ncbi:hypothetical protein ONZ45_g7177 [Pleurotus djamor]|nr:hypothetical protein ONZ45_g7177 [Pleurotus djamor]
MKIVCALRTRRNTFAAISKLPNEIIAEIFIACRTLREIFNHTPSAIILVCTAWRDIALSTPQVWSHISFEDPNSISRSLVHSKKEPLTVECDAYHFYGFEQRHPMRLLARETYRFEELRIRGPGYDTSRMAAQFFQKDGSPSAPLLQKLSIQVDVGRDGDEDSMIPWIMTSFWKDLTAVRSMTLLRILPISTPYLPSLRHLTIDVSSEGRFLSIPWVIQLLRNAPLLENVTIGKISSDHPISLTPPLPIAIPLLGLRTIKLKLKYLQESKLLSYLQIPDTANVDIEFQGCGDTRKIQENISHLRRFISTRFPPDSSLDVRVVMAAFTDDDYTLTVGTNASTDQFQLRIMDFPSPLRREDNIVTSLPLGAIHNLRFWGSMDDEEGQAWSKLLPFLVHLRSVHTDRVEILRLLVGPEPSSPNITSADFNNLDLLTIRVETEWRAKYDDWMFFTYFSL